MAKKLYVGNLTYEVSSSDLEQMFQPHGKVEIGGGRGAGGRGGARKKP